MNLTQNASNKKAQERQWVDTFINLYGRSLKEMIVTECETPDFTLHNFHKKISIEVTSIVNSEIKKEESLRQKIVNKAKEKSIGKYLPGLQIDVTFIEEPIICKGTEIEKFADQLCEKVEMIYNKGNVKDESRLRSFEEQYEDGIIKSISLSPNQSQAGWFTFDGFVFPTIDPLLLIERIAEKEKILKKYAVRYNENWLLLVANLWEGSSSYDFTNIKKAIKFTTKFHQVFIYLFDENRFIRLK